MGAAAAGSPEEVSEGVALEESLVAEESARVYPVPEIRAVAEATRTSVREPSGAPEDWVLGEAAASTPAAGWPAGRNLKAFLNMLMAE